MRAIIVRGADQPFQLEERDPRDPGAGEIRLKVEACGVCHSDQFVKDGLWPGLELPRVPGHEVVGIVDAVGAGVGHIAVGDRVGIGWHGGHDGVCPACLRGKFIHCDDAGITGISFDGGYQESMVAPAIAAAKIPAGLDPAEAAPLLCAGVTTFNALRNAGARPGDLVAVQGLGGLGHLGVQFAKQMGFRVAAVSRGTDKREFAERLGADHYVDAAAGDPGAALTELGGASVILATAPSGKAISPLVGGLGLEGCLLIVAAPFDPIEVGPIDLISRDARVQGWSSGTAADSQEALEFAARTGVSAMIERFPLADAQAGYDRMISNQARFRVVLDVA